MECPKCQSENVQAMPVAYHAGVSNIDTTSKSGARLGVGLAGGGLGVGVLGGGRNKTESISVSSLSQQLAPPVQMTSGRKKFGRYTLGCLSLGAVVIFLMCVAAASQGAIAASVVIVAVLIGAGYWIYYSIGKDNAEADKVRKYNQDVFPGLMDAWNRSWFCLRCGNVFEVSP